MQSFLLKNSTMFSAGKDDFGFYDPLVKEMIASLPNPVPLGELLVEAKYGASRKANYSDEGIRFIRAQSIREWGIDSTDECYFPMEDYEELKRYLLKAGDVLITRSGVNVGDSAVIPPELEGSVYGSYSIRLRFNDDVVPQFVSIILNSHIGKMQVAVLSTRSAQPNINIKEIRSVIIPLPHPDMQQRVVRHMQAAYIERKQLLDKAGKVIPKAKREIESLILKMDVISDYDDDDIVANDGTVAITA